MNDRQNSTRPDSAASALLDFREAYGGLEELICTARDRVDVLCILATGFWDRDVVERNARISEHDFKCLLFMIEEVRRAVSTLDERYQDYWPSEAARIARTARQQDEAR